MIAILGAGLAGLTAAHHLRRAGREDVVILEREGRAGGLCRSEHIDGYTFDYTGHYLHFRRPAIRDWVMGLAGDNIHEVTRKAWIYSHGVYTPYPFQANTFGLPTAVVRECLLGFIEAALAARPAAGGPEASDPDQSFEDWILATLGSGIARHFMIPYNTKLWTIPPHEMTTEWMGRFVPRPTIEEVVDGALIDRRDRPFGYNAHFLYPIAGGIQVLPDAIAPGAGEIRLSTVVTAIDPEKRELRLRDFDAPLAYETLVTTMPLDALVRMLDPKPDLVRAAGGRLRHNSVLSVNLGVEGRELSPYNWVYFPEPEFCFYRLGFPSNSSPRVAPPGASSVTAEVAFSAARPLDRAATVRQVKADLERIGILRRGDRIGVEAVFEIPCAYVLYDHARRGAVDSIQAYLKSRGILSVGRYGAWEYSSMEDAITGGREAAELILNAEVTP
jgi:protoporphyrinogen oxidase